MPIIERISRAYQNALTIFSGRGGGGSNYAIRSSNYQRTRFDWKTEAGDYRQNSIVALCLDWQARNACSVPIKLYTKTRLGDKVEIEGHPVLDLLNKPNPVYDGNTLATAIFNDVMTEGNGFLYVAMNNGGRPGELYWFDARYVAPDYPTDGSAFLHSWKYTPAGTGKIQNFDPSTVAHLRIGVDSMNDRLGYSPLQACRREIALVNLLAGYTAGVLKNVGATNIVISPNGENTFTPDMAEEIRMSTIQAISGDMAGSPLVYTMPTTVNSIGGFPKDLMLNEVDQTAVARICGAFGQSPMIHGLPDSGKTYSNYREALRASWLRSVKPMHRLMCEALCHRLLPFFDRSGRMFLEYDYSSVEALAEDRDILAKTCTVLFKEGVIQLNEARDIMGLPPVDIGDRFKWEIDAEMKEEESEDETDSEGPEDLGEESETDDAEAEPAIESES